MLASLDIRATGMPTVDAQADFRRARRSHVLGRIGRWVGRRSQPVRPLSLGGAAAPPAGAPRFAVVPLDCIVGTVEPSDHFDARFRPASEVVRQRWERVALAHRRGDALPPIKLWSQPEGFYVDDGRHRVSVARALGYADIDAWVRGGATCA